MAIAKAFRANRAIPFFVGIAQLADRIYTPVRHLNVGANIGLQHLTDFHRFMVLPRHDGDLGPRLRRDDGYISFLAHASYWGLSSVCH